MQNPNEKNSVSRIKFLIFTFAEYLSWFFILILFALSNSFGIGIPIYIYFISFCIAFYLRDYRKNKIEISLKDDEIKIKTAYICNMSCNNPDCKFETTLQKNFPIFPDNMLEDFKRLPLRKEQAKYISGYLNDYLCGNCNTKVQLKDDEEVICSNCNKELDPNSYASCPECKIGKMEDDESKIIKF